MKARVIILAGVLAVFASGNADACGPGTLAMVKSLENVDRPPLLRCGSGFNEFLKLAHQKNWPAALAAYEAHLSGIGSWEANTPEAAQTLEYLKSKVSSSR